MKIPAKKKQKKEQRTSFRFSIYEKKRRYRVGLSLLVSLVLHFLLFLRIFFMPLSFEYVPPTITLEMWQPEEQIEEPETPASTVAPDQGGKSNISQGYLSAMMRYREMEDTAQPQDKVASTATQLPSNTQSRPIIPSASYNESISEDVAEVKNPFPKDENTYDTTQQEEEPAPTSPTEEILDERAIIGEELADILSGSGEGQWLGETLMNLYLSQRVLLVKPDLGFLSQQSFTSKSKAVKMELRILPSGAVEDVKIIFPGTGNLELDQRLRIAFSQVLFNDVTAFGRDVETGVIVLNFKG